MFSSFKTVYLRDDRCQGCVNCLKNCPVEAIRIRNGKSRVIEERCIGCGVCIKVCPNKAKVAWTDSLDELQKARYNIVLPSPVLCTQFPSKYSNAQILTALKSLGFDEVIETAIGAEKLAASIDLDRVESQFELKKPLISSSCPVVVRLIQLKFPSLLKHLLPIKSPIELISSLVLPNRLGDLSLDANEIGLFYIVPCPLECAVLKAHQFDQGDNPQVNLLSIKQIYPEIMKMLVKQTEPSVKSCSTAMGDSWSIVGGEAAALGIDNYIAVDGVKNVIDILGQLELGKLNTIRFLEAKACPGGCVGGALTVENRFIAQRKVKGVWREKNSTDFSEQPLIKTSWIQENQIYAERAGFNPVFQLDSDLNIALKKIKRIEQLLNVLPGLDCGSCGAPSCKALAEDLVQGAADKLDCVYVLKSEIDKLVGRIRTIVQQEETSVSTDHKRLSYLDTFLTKLNLLDHRTFPLVSKDREQEEVD